MPNRNITARLNAASDRTASLALMLGGVLWGVIWIPIRALEAQGLPGAWPGFVIYATTLILLIPLIIQRRHTLKARLAGLTLCGLGAGGAFSLYATSILLTDVVHAILLFYLTPLWGTLLGLAFLGERLTVARCASLLLGLIGLFVVLGGGSGGSGDGSGGGGLPWPRNLGDWLALAAGLAWAIGTFGMYRMKSIATSDQMIAFMTGALLCTGVTLLIGGPHLGGTLTASALVGAVPWALLTAFCVLPMLVLTIWPASRLTPGRVGLLLMTDVIAAIASAAWLAGEPFGAQEIAGSILMISAAAVEVLARRS